MTTSMWHSSGTCHQHSQLRQPVRLLPRSKYQGEHLPRHLPKGHPTSACSSTEASKQSKAATERMACKTNLCLSNFDCDRWPCCHQTELQSGCLSSDCKSSLKDKLKNKEGNSTPSPGVSSKRGKQIIVAICVPWHTQNLCENPVFSSKARLESENGIRVRFVAFQASKTRHRLFYRR